MSEKAKYAEIYGQSRRVTAEDRDAFHQIWHKIWGEEMAYELAPTNFLTWHELHRVAAELRVRAGSRFVDLGCGGGGPGLWSLKGQAPVSLESTSRQRHARPRDIGRRLTTMRSRPSIASRT